MTKFMHGIIKAPAIFLAQLISKFHIVSDGERNHWKMQKKKLKLSKLFISFSSTVIFLARL